MNDINRSELKEELSEYQASVLIPAYNEAEAIGDVLDNLRSSVPEHFEILVIDDASTDETGKIAEARGVKVITHKVNRGYGASLKTGLQNARNDIVIFFDADGQHEVSYLLPLLEAVHTADMAVGARQNVAPETWWRVPGKWFIHRLANYLANEKIPDLNCGLRAVRRRLLLRYEHLFSDRFSFSTTSTLVLLGEGYLIDYIPMTVHSRIGKSNVSIRTGFETILLVIRMIVQFNPLRVFMPMVFATGVIGSAFFIHDLVRLNVSNTTIVLFLATVMLFCFGILADQIASVRKELSRRHDL